MRHTADWAAPKRWEKSLFLLAQHRLVCSSISSSECTAVQVQNISSVSPAKLTVTSHQEPLVQQGQTQALCTLSMGGEAQPASRHAGSSRLDCGFYFKEICGDYKRGFMGPVHPEWGWEVLKVTKAEVELSWQGVMQQTGQKHCKHQEFETLNLYWHRSGYSSGNVPFKSIAVPVWKGK